MMAIDTSAIVAVLRLEPEANRLASEGARAPGAEGNRTGSKAGDVSRVRAPARERTRTRVERG